MNKELPAFSATNLTSNSTAGFNLVAVHPGTATTWTSDGTDASKWQEWYGDQRAQALPANINAYRRDLLAGARADNSEEEEEIDDMAVNGKGKLRVVRIFLVDPDERIPAERRVLFRSDEMTTDATDQELFFDIPVNNLLREHNTTTRATTKWEEKTADGVRERTGLKEVRIRDLVMSVTTIAAFEGRAA
jgi:hypothetical protein